MMVSVSVRSGLRAGATGIADQVLLSVANLTVGLALARELEPSAFGAYVVAFAILLMGSSVQVSLITDPLMILGSPMAAARQSRYLAALLRLQMGLSLSLGALIGAVALALHLAWRDTSHLPAALAGSALAVVSLQLLSFFRAVFFASLRPGAALAIDVVFAALSVAGVSLLIVVGRLSPFAAFAATGIGALVATAAAMWQCRALLATADDLRATWAMQWQYGRWILAAGAAYWCSGQAPTVLASTVLGPVAAAVIKACQYLVAPLNVAFTGMDGVLAPRAARVRAERGEAELLSFLKRFTMVAGTSVILYATLIVPSSPSLMRFLYKGKYSEGTQYSGNKVIVALMLLQALLAALMRAPTLRLKVAGDTRRVFIGYLLGAAAGIFGLMLLSPFFGIVGAAAAPPISSAALLVFLFIGERSSRMNDSGRVAAAVAKF